MIKKRLSMINLVICLEFMSHKCTLIFTFLQNHNNMSCKQINFSEKSAKIKSKIKIKL